MPDYYRSGSLQAGHLNIYIYNIDGQHRISRTINLDLKTGYVSVYETHRRGRDRRPLRVRVLKNRYPAADPELKFDLKEMLYNNETYYEERVFHSWNTPSVGEFWWMWKDAGYVANPCSNRLRLILEDWDALEAAVTLLMATNPGPKFKFTKDIAHAS